MIRWTKLWRVHWQSTEILEVQAETPDEAVKKVHEALRQRTGQWPFGRAIKVEEQQTPYAHRGVGDGKG